MTNQKNILELKFSQFSIIYLFKIEKYILSFNRHIILLFLLSFSFHTIKGEITAKELVEIQQNAATDGRLKDVIDYGKIALESYRAGNNDSILWKAFDLGGNAAVESRRYIEALEFYLISVEFGEKFHLSRCKIIGLNNIGNIYESFGDYERAKHYYLRAYETAKTFNDNYMRAASLLNLVNICSLLEDVESARNFYSLQENTSLHSPEETNYWRLLSSVSILLAEKNFEEAVKIAKQTKDSALYHNFREDLVALSVDRIAKAFVGQKLIDSAIYYSKFIVDNPRAETSYPDLLVNAYNILSESYGVKIEPDSVNKYQLLALHLSDSIYNRRKFNAATDLLLKYEDQEIQSHIYTLNHQIHFKNTWIIIVVCALFLVFIILVIIQYNNRRLKRANALLISKNNELRAQSVENNKLREQLADLYEKTEINGIQESESEEDSTSSINLSEQQYLILLRDINRVMDDSSVISDPSFSLVKLAHMVQSNTTYVSMAINTTYKKNFKTFLNEKRVQLAAERLLEKKNYTIQSISESVGFKSVSNFIAAFKKIMGMNPSVYRRISF